MHTQPRKVHDGEREAQAGGGTDTAWSGRWQGWDWSTIGKRRLLPEETGMIIGLFEWLWRSSGKFVGYSLVTDTHGDIGRKLGLGESVGLETGSCLLPGGHRNSR